MGIPYGPMVKITFPVHEAIGSIPGQGNRSTGHVVCPLPHPTSPKTVSTYLSSDTWLSKCINRLNPETVCEGVVCLLFITKLHCISLE